MVITRRSRGPNRGQQANPEREAAADLGHPAISAAIRPVAQLTIGPNGLALRERGIAAPVPFGFSPDLAVRAYSAICNT
jgi:hypothetical protein